MFFASLSTKTRKLFCAGDFVLRHSFAAGDFISRQQPFFFRVPFGTCSFAIGVPFVAFVGSLVLVSGWFGHCSGQVTCVCLFEFWHFVGVLGFFEGFFSDCFGLGFVYFLGYLCFTHCASLYVDSVFVVRDGCKKDCFVFPG